MTRTLLLTLLFLLIPSCATAHIKPPSLGVPTIDFSPIPDGNADDVQLNATIPIQILGLDCTFGICLQVYGPGEGQVEVCFDVEDVLVEPVCVERVLEDIVVSVPYSLDAKGNPP